MVKLWVGTLLESAVEDVDEAHHPAELVVPVLEEERLERLRGVSRRSVARDVCACVCVRERERDA
jgi:hypothetical protein